MDAQLDANFWRGNMFSFFSGKHISMLPVNAEETAEATATVARGAFRHGDLIGWRGSANEELKFRC